LKETLTISYKNENLGEIKGFIDEKGEPWFYAAKVCDCLKIKNSSDAINGIIQKHLTYGDKIKGVDISYTLLQTTGGKQRVTIINEKILYELIFQSRTKKAFEFQQWVFGEVLPALRKRGEYRMQGKLIRRSLTDTIQTEICDKTDNPNEKRFAYSNYSKLINKSLGLPSKVDRNTLSADMLEKVARKENLVQALITENKSYAEIKQIILS
jgi:prophage antirepressor-like protein